MCVCVCVRAYLRLKLHLKNMRYFLLLISFCITYKQATSQGIRKPCQQKIPLGPKCYIVEEGCLIRGVCVKYGTKVDAIPFCMTYVCERRGHGSFVRHKVTGCLLNRVCHSIGTKIQTRNPCYSIHCIHMYPSYIGWRGKLDGCLIDSACRKVGEKVYSENLCAERICKMDQNGYQVYTNRTGCRINGSCQDAGTRIKSEDGCVVSICDRMGKGFGHYTEAAGCILNNKCYPPGWQHQESSCISFKCQSSYKEYYWEKIIRC
ncbi:uncharacterized protein LOC115232515 isoform X3 [Octopus sinensis]|uniref:Uncharacterized protein LOC115232515 isoform X3 n=1 Tax=Octopus sinensis TaxID=2607531 RepID=A0A7E6EH59_9MOLL|nr:uncharacterized protein LOC115232515 isoform X3 [Octopus sinensis]